MPEKSSQHSGDKEEKSPNKAGNENNPGGQASPKQTDRNQKTAEEKEIKKSAALGMKNKEAKSAAEEEWKAPSDEESGGEGTGWIELPDEADFWRPPARFGSIPVEKEPMGWDRRLGFRKLFPRISLPFQVVERVRFGHPELNPNRLFCGDNLQVMRS